MKRYFECDSDAYLSEMKLYGDEPPSTEENLTFNEDNSIKMSSTHPLSSRPEPCAKHPEKRVSWVTFGEYTFCSFCLGDHLSANIL